MSELVEIRDYWLERIKELERQCTLGQPWVFVAACTLLRRLGYMIPTEDGDPREFPAEEFTLRYLAQVRPEYRNFTFQNGEMDLPYQIAAVLGLGLTYSFSTRTPMLSAKEGRPGSLIIAHRHDYEDTEIKREHLDAKTDQGFDACVLIAEDLVDDLQQAAALFFQDAEDDPEIESQVRASIMEFPPLDPTIQ